MTLNELCDDVLLEARNNNIGESEKLSRYQIMLWIKTYRAYLLKQKLDKGEQLDQIFYQTIRMHLDKIEEDPGHAEYQGDKELPTLLGTKLTTSVITVKDAYGNIIQLGSETKMKFQRYRKYTCKDYIAYVKGNRIYVEGDANQLEYIDVEIIGCPIVREADGLAKSSRNTYLSPEERKAALVLSQTINLAKQLIADGEKDADVLVAKMKENIEKEPLAKIDYVKAVNGLTMQQQKEIKAPMLIAMAVYIGKTRLIDNTILH